MVDMALSTRSGLLSAGVAVRWVVAGSLPNGVSVQFEESRLCVVGLVCGPIKPWFYLHRWVALSIVKNGFLLP